MEPIDLINQYLDQDMVMSLLKKNMGHMELMAITPFVPFGISYVRNELEKIMDQEPEKKQLMGRQIISIASAVFGVPVNFSLPDDKTG